VCSHLQFGAQGAELEWALVQQCMSRGFLQAVDPTPLVCRSNLSEYGPGNVLDFRPHGWQQFEGSHFYGPFLAPSCTAPIAALHTLLSDALCNLVSASCQTLQDVVNMVKERLRSKLRWAWDRSGPNPVSAQHEPSLRIFLLDGMKKANNHLCYSHAHDEINAALRSAHPDLEDMFWQIGLMCSQLVYEQGVTMSKQAHPFPLLWSKDSVTHKGKDLGVLIFPAYTVEAHIIAYEVDWNVRAECVMSLGVHKHNNLLRVNVQTYSWKRSVEPGQLVA
jgi:hypothetical protein